MEAHELLRIVGLKMDRAEEDMVLAVMSQTGGTLTNTQRNRCTILSQQTELNSLLKGLILLHHGFPPFFAGSTPHSSAR